MNDTQQGKSVYLAARYSRYPEMQQVRSLLDALGYTVTSRWINGGHELTKEGSTEAHEAERIRYAQEDMADLLAADIVISFTEEPRTTKTRGGRHVEFGVALATGKRAIVIGHRENVFHTLPEVDFFATLEECIAAEPWPLRRIPTQREMNQAFYVDVCRLEDENKLGRAALAVLIDMHRKEELSEGQCCQMLDMERVAFRKLVDEAP